MLRQFCTGIVFTELKWKAADGPAQARRSQRAQQTGLRFTPQRRVSLLPPAQRAQGIFQAPKQAGGRNSPSAEASCAPSRVPPSCPSPKVLPFPRVSGRELCGRDSLAFPRWVALQVCVLFRSCLLTRSKHEAASGKNSKHPFN